MRGWLGRVKRVFAKCNEQRWACAHCGRPVDPHEFTCDDEACWIGALEAQAMLAPVHAWPPLVRELHVVWSSPTPLRDAAHGVMQGLKTV